ncbi:MAG: chromosome segregation SMC family protein, partial [Bacteroidia bacterium]
MQLTSLEIYGFKSFADRTKFAFDSGITGIVGPNGCGKSNIVDSIRWVLGEQKARYLRSDKMENVIFNGTNARRKSNFVEVSLTFENTKNILPTEYSTITITRKLYRTGESEYLINGVKCRLKDIDDLFMDTGISSDSYAIIELKMVDEILTNKDQERRRFFEEASGISKYKIRKKQTLKKLEETDNDLTRVEDLLAEIEKNMKSLERQAKRTQKYFELKEEYKKISSQYAFLKIQSIKGQQVTLEGQMEGLNDELTEVQAQMALKEAKIAELKKQLIDNEQALSESQQNLNKHLRLIQEKEAQRNVKNERSKYLHQRQTAIMAQIETDKKQLEKLQDEVEVLQVKQERMAVEVQQAEGLKTQLQSELQKAQESQNIRQQKVKEAENEFRELETELRGFVREKDMQSV